MPKRLPNETIEQFAIRSAFEAGYFWNPELPNGLNISQKDLPKLTADMPVVIEALRAFAMGDSYRYTNHVLNSHKRVPNFDGEVGPAMAMYVMDGARCPVPDFAPPAGVSFLFEDPGVQQIALKMQRDALAALGSGGNWAGCNNMPNIHCGAMLVNTAGISPKVAPHVKTILTAVRKAYAGIGFLWKFIGMDGVDILTGEKFEGTIQTKLSFVQSSSGWIGLALVGNRESCSSVLWLQLLATYIGGTTVDQIINQQFSLLTHEAGHNLGLGHTNGGIMNPSLQNGLPVGVWSQNDPSTQKLISLYSGVSVPIPGDNGPTSNPIPPKTLESRVKHLENQAAMQAGVNAWLVDKIESLS